MTESTYLWLWNVGLAVLIAIIGFWAREKVTELHRIGILLNKTREEVARENVTLNGVEERVTVRHGSLPGGGDVPLHFAPEGQLELISEGQFDLVAINILAPVVAGMAPALAARLAAGGTVVAAGLIDTQESTVRSALQAQGLVIVQRTQEKDWICLVARRDAASRSGERPSG